MSFGYSLPLCGELHNLLVSLLHFSLDVFLVALGPTASLTVAFKVIGLLSKTHHLQIDQLVLQFVYLQLSIHTLDLAS